MHIIQHKLFTLAKSKNLAELSLKAMASGIGMPEESPQKIKHHLEQLLKKGLLTFDPDSKTINCAQTEPSIAEGFLESTGSVFSLPILGSANCGPATFYAEENVQGFLRVSSKLVGKTSPSNLYAIKTDGNSMNRAEIGGKKIEDGDYVIVDAEQRTVTSNDIIIAIVDGKATVKRFIADRENNQIVLMADSSYNYDPIYLHDTDSFSVSGKVISIVKRPKMNNY
jgi:SOS-response transcriptional repressor LexA